jgi:hypothetical protein
LLLTAEMKSSSVFQGDDFFHRQQHRISEHARERNEVIHLVRRRLALQPIGLGDDGER